MVSTRGYNAPIGGTYDMNEWWNTPVNDPVDRLTFLPLAEENGGLTPALPWVLAHPVAAAKEAVDRAPGIAKSLVTEPFYSLGRVMANAGRRDTTYDDAGVPISGINALQPGDGLNAVGLAPMGTMALNAVPHGVGVFGGRLAKTADHNALARAERMAAEGAPREDIWNQTGWFQGPDQKWRFEIDDSGLTTSVGSKKAPGLTGGGPIQHNALAAAYPDMAPNVTVSQGVMEGGYIPPYQPSILERLTGYASGDPWDQFGAERLRVSGPSKLDRDQAAAHELQHAIQQREGFSGGANVRNGQEAYYNNPGEIESRNAETRLHLSPEERKSFPPWVTAEWMPDRTVVRNEVKLADGRKRIADLEAKAASLREQLAGITIMPERQAFDDAIRGIGLNPQDKYMRAWAESMKGSRLTDDGAKTLNSIETMARQMNSPEFQALGTAIDNYRTKAQQIGHNGGPPPSEWDDPFIYANPESSAAAPLALSIADNAAETGLPMDLASRMARAKEMGFDTDTTWWHGSPVANMTEITPGQKEPGAWFTTDKYNAANYARGDTPSLYDTHLRSKKPMIVEFNDDGLPTVGGQLVDFDNNVDIVRYAQRQGYDSVRFPSGNFSESGDTMVVFDPRNIRSVNAAFDPAMSDSANLLAANAYPALAAPLMLSQDSEGDNIDINDLIRRYIGG